MSVFLYSYNYSLYTNTETTNLQQNAVILQEELSNWLAEKRNFMREIGTRMTDQDSPKNFRIITNSLNELEEEVSHGESPFYLSWALPSGKVVFQSKPNFLVNGKLPDISDRHYFQSARKNPWTMQILPVNGIQNKTNKHSQQILSLAMGIESSEGQYLGSLILDVGMDLFYKHFKQLVPNQNDNFILVDNNCNILFQSVHHTADSKISDCEPGAIDQIKNSQGFLGTVFSLGTITYPYYAKLKNEPYIIYTGYDKALLEQNLHGKILPKLYSFLLIGILCMDRARINFNIYVTAGAIV